MELASVITLMRPQQYIKNLFIFLPLFFAMEITNTGLLLNAFIAFIAFSLTASAIYTLNDYYDIEEDRQHPTKKDRPLASGALSKPHAIIVMSLLLLTGGILMACLSIKALAVLTIYVVMNIAYSLSLKHISIVDVNIIALGFVLRLFIGSTVTNIPLSKWIVIMTFLLAIFMALAKRRDDVLIFLHTGKKMRKVIDGYNLQFLDTAMAIMASVVIVAYTIYTTSAEVTERLSSEYLYLTSFFVILGILRYLKISLVNGDSGSPTKIVTTDTFIQLTLLGWIITFTWILY
ncbi:decaprenyl-phosphate phosphoribosyltransferase [Granulosicoccus antarcticus]|uniref:Decaprenyl-phosphate phosphoribosyltransferase n=1 Tax=Granulosicoccus antarcticus IMCC3135 TaxID=1192854 RepID=A0A2Z2NVF3_9GAMM|nr:decaprenyl-phosphate phosphoribosyltransferase [Granulosicoccus antarcticus]ASJ74495.1 Decaprenyl-phosphate phosphoribosyltransferase [Granulosicoccus antarcticus IMCC3135]